MPETKIQPEDIAAAEKIIAVYSEGVSGATWEREVAACSAIIGASRPPLVSRLVARVAQLEGALKAVVSCADGFPETEAADAVEKCRAALSAAPALDLGEVEGALELARVTMATVAAHVPTSSSGQACARGAEACAAALAQVQEVTR